MSLLPDVTDLLYDPDVGGNQPFVIVRTTVTNRKGRYYSAVSERIQAAGSVQPAGTNALAQIPEGDRDDAVYIVRTRTPILMGVPSDTGGTLTDEIIYLGQRYKVLSVREWHAWGMYVANVTRIEPSTAQENAVVPVTPAEPQEEAIADAEP